MHAKTWFPSNEMHESPNLTNGPLCFDPYSELVELALMA